MHSRRTPGWSRTLHRLIGTPTCLVTATKGETSWRLRGIPQLFHSTKLLTSGSRVRERCIKNTNTWRSMLLGPRHLLISLRSSNRWLESPLPHHHRSIHCRQPQTLARVLFRPQTCRGRWCPGCLQKESHPRSIPTGMCTMTVPSIGVPISPPRGMRRTSGTFFC